MSDQEEKISQFVGVTGVNDQRARFFLESSGWQVEVRFSNIYKHNIHHHNTFDFRWP